ncbi:uncharacterized protein LOC131856319 [Cryptomeria japonica]|uniref:uncharacterized protein LOC131856319 n=1 Tax=Cryptomeria japonica TaxID=3369 RepID=UPI0027DA531C|nr:uncharacterized protein LOC131856319 [Cryptomeria japonica]
MGDGSMSYRELSNRLVESKEAFDLLKVKYKASLAKRRELAKKLLELNESSSSEEETIDALSNEVEKALAEFQTLQARSWDIRPRVVDARVSKEYTQYITAHPIPLISDPAELVPEFKDERGRRRGRGGGRGPIAGLGGRGDDGDRGGGGGGGGGLGVQIQWRGRGDYAGLLTGRTDLTWHCADVQFCPWASGRLPHGRHGAAYFGGCRRRMVSSEAGETSEPSVEGAGGGRKPRRPAGEVTGQRRWRLHAE